MDVVYYVASSADGYIAGPRGDLSWLDPYNGPDYGYSSFYRKAAHLVMGSGTFDTALGFDAWPYPGKSVTVFTSKRYRRIPEGVRLFRNSPGRFRARGTVWLVGGGKLAASFLNAGLIDELRLFVIPVILGAGTPLFARPRRRSFHLTRMKRYGQGVVELRYRI